MSQHPHLFLPDIKDPIPFTSNSTRGETNIPERDRITHSQRLVNRFNQVWGEEEAVKNQRAAIAIKTRGGTYLEFKSQQGFNLATKSLEDIRQGVRLLNIRERDNETFCTVFIPAGKENLFLDKINQYADDTKNTKTGNPKNKNLVNSIEDVQLALLESLWTDPLDLIPDITPRWCEIWLRHENNDAQAVITSFIEILVENEIEYKPNYILFPERAIILVRANRVQLTELIAQTDSLAEIRIAQETAGFWTKLSNSEQQQWTQDLINRLNINPDTLIRVCILDSGINNGHELLAPILEDENCMAVVPHWNVNDHESGSGHGTLMGGIAAYNSLEELLESTDTFNINHKLCSVKILPPPSQEATPIELWGDITAQAISRAEINLPDNKFVYCMAVTSTTDVDRGRPSSWSGAIDSIAYNDDEGEKRLIIISAGNVKNIAYWDGYPETNLASSVQNPAQSWNSLVVGAYTDKVTINDESYSTYSPVASKGCLSPFSSTSSFWDKKWPIKPDVVFEGGNLLRDEEGNYDEGYDDFGLLSTAKEPLRRQFDTINATSAATAKASWMAAQIMHHYPEAWPESVRALIIHSAEWREEMFQQFQKNNQSKADVKDLMRIFGYGIPNINKAIYSYNNSLTFISQNIIQPFKKDGSSYRMNEMHFFNLPWPKEELQANPDIAVTLKVTLSYFIEPGPGEVGWKDKYRYRSHGLCFDVNSETETSIQFQKRINKAVREEDEGIESDSGSERWLIGTKGRRNGSVHSDTWHGTAGQLADCNMIAVFPIIGWWRERKHLHKYNTSTRYSLIVSLETPNQEVQLYTPVVTEIQNIVPITV